MPFPLEGHFFRFSPNCEGYSSQAFQKGRSAFLAACKNAVAFALPRSPKVLASLAADLALQGLRGVPQNKDFQPILSVSTCAFLSPIF
jgi:hypothetical protein